MSTPSETATGPAAAKAGFIGSIAASLRETETADRLAIAAAMTSSFAVLFLEISYFHALQFLTSYLDSNLVISCALLGISLGGMLAFFFARHGRMLADMALLLLPAAAIGGLAGAAYLMDNEVAHVLSETPPFILGSVVISSVFARRRVHLIYFADLTGAGLGALAAAIFIPLLREEGCVFLVAVVVQVVALVLVFKSYSGHERRGWMLANGLFLAGSLALLIAHVAADPFNLVTLGLESEKHASKVHSMNTRIERRHAERPDKVKLMPLHYSRGSLVERIDVFKEENLNWYNVAYNGLLNDHVSRQSVGSHYWDIRVPNCWTGDKADVLVIGTAAEGVTKSGAAISKGGDMSSEGGDLVGLEINPAIVDVVLNTKIHKFGRNFYDGYDLHVLDARTYFARTDKQFDLITMANTHRIRTLGHIGPPDYLHTLEATEVLLDHLKPTGYLAVEERNINDLAEAGIARWLLTVREALKNKGQQEPGDCVVLYEFYPGKKKGRRSALYFMAMVRPTPFTEEDVNKFVEWSEHDKVTNRGKRTMMIRHLPGQPYDNKFSRIIRGEDPAEVMAGTGAVLTPVPTDDRPFPYDVYPERTEVHRLIRVVFIAAAIMVLIPLIFGAAWRGRKGRAPGAVAALAVFGGAVGLAYILVEIVFIEWLSKYLGSPGRSLILVLPTMLIASGIGGVWSGNLAQKGRIKAMLIILPLLVLLGAAMPVILDVTQGLPFFLRALVAIVILFPVSFLMGVPLPFAIDLVKQRAAPRHATV
ncbi:MAG: TIGR04086 family membrane protein, partial [Deltaproteobacteria bacterium]|nr:TIGR04086 family membrane protein [Deltaproteobacteria bacterium]